MRLASFFVTGGSGFIGQVIIQQVVDAGHQVQALVRSETAAAKVRALQAQPVMGDLLHPGPWQSIAAQSDYIIHLAQPLTFGGRITRSRAEQYRAERVTMEAHLLGHLASSNVQRILYVGGTSYYGQQGSALKDETTTPNPRGWGPYVVEAFTALQTYIARGLPIVEAFPGGVYGAGSWYLTVLEALHARRRLIGITGHSRIFTSSIHVEDCARAILHLVGHGQVGERYFLVDDRPNTNHELARLTAEALQVPLRTFMVLPLLARLLLGPVMTDALTYENRLSNAKLRSTGFQCHFPTLDEGIPAVVEAWLKTHHLNGGSNA